MLSVRRLIPALVGALAACGPGHVGTGSTTDGGSSSSSSDTASSTTSGSASDSTASTGAALPPTPCLPAGLVGPLLESTAGMNLYENLANDGFVIEHVGAELVVDMAGIQAMRDVTDELQTLSPHGVLTVGTGLIVSGKSEIGIRIGLATHTATPLELAALVDSLYAPGDICMAYAVDLIGATAPRCEETDPECVPEPYCGSLDYDPNGPRDPIAEADNLDDGTCEHDGDCYRAGCGQFCHAWTVPGIISFCPGTGELACGLCGCVEGQCRWFTQDPECPCAQP